MNNIEIMPSDKKFEVNFPDIIDESVYGILRDWCILTAQQKNNEDVWTTIPCLPNYMFKNISIESDQFDELVDSTEVNITLKYDAIRCIDTSEWNTLDITPPNERVEVKDANGNIALAEPTYYPFEIVHNEGDEHKPWGWRGTPVFHEDGEVKWDGGWAVLHNGLCDPLDSDIVAWRLITDKTIDELYSAKQ